MNNNKQVQEAHLKDSVKALEDLKALAEWEEWEEWEVDNNPHSQTFLKSLKSSLVVPDPKVQEEEAKDNNNKQKVKMLL